MNTDESVSLKKCGPYIYLNCVLIIAGTFFIIGCNNSAISHHHPSAGSKNAMIVDSILYHSGFHFIMIEKDGNELVFRVAIKPTSSTPLQQQTLNWTTGEVESFAVRGRHDLCIALRVPPVLEAITAIVLADLLLISQKLNRINH